MEQSKTPAPELFLWDGITGTLEEVTSLQDAEKFVKENYAIRGEGIHPDIETCYVVQRYASVFVDDATGKITVDPDWPAAGQRGAYSEAQPDEVAVARKVLTRLLAPYQATVVHESVSAAERFAEEGAAIAHVLGLLASLGSAPPAEEGAASVMVEFKKYLQREVELKFLKQKDVDRITWYIDTYFLSSARSGEAAPQSNFPISAEDLRHMIDLWCVDQYGNTEESLNKANALHASFLTPQPAQEGAAAPDITAAQVLGVILDDIENYGYDAEMVAGKIRNASYADVRAAAPTGVEARELCDEAQLLVLKLLPPDQYGEHEDVERLYSIVSELVPAALASAPAAPAEAWVAVEDRLPESRQCVLIYVNGNRRASIGHYHENNQIWYTGNFSELPNGSVTHWMPLPAPPARIDQNK